MGARGTMFQHILGSFELNEIIGISIKFYLTN
jgi:hypothetical protein